MPGAGALDTPIVIERAAGTPNSLNEEVQVWAPFVSVRARKRDSSDLEKQSAGQVGSALMARFVVRSSAETRTVTPKDRLTCDGHTWSLIGAKDTNEGRHRFIELTAVRDADG